MSSKNTLKTGKKVLNTVQAMKKSSFSFKLLKQITAKLVQFHKT